LLIPDSEQIVALTFLANRAFENSFLFVCVRRSSSFQSTFHTLKVSFPTPMIARGKQRDLEVNLHFEA
jgi:hypothetical protein